MEIYLLDQMVPELERYYKESEWAVFFRLISPVQRQILWTIANECETIESIADKCLRSVSEILPLVAELEKAGVLSSYEVEGIVDPAYFFCRISFEAFCKEIPVRQVFKPVEILSELTREFQALARRRITRINQMGINFSADAIEDRLAEVFCFNK